MTWIETIRDAVELYLLHEMYQAEGTAESPGTLRLPAALTGDTTSFVGRKVTVTDAANSGNVGVYTITSMLVGNDGFALTPAWPVASGAIEFNLQTKVDRTIRKWFWFRAGGALPPVYPTADDCPMISVFPTRVSPRQANNADIEWAFTMHFMLAAAGRHPSGTTTLVGNLIDRLVRGRHENFRLGSSSGLQSCEPSSVSLEPKAPRDKEDHIIEKGVFWSAEFDWIGRIRRGVIESA